MYNLEFLFQQRVLIKMRDLLDNQAIDKMKEEIESQDKNKGLTTQLKSLNKVSKKKFKIKIKIKTFKKKNISLPRGKNQENLKKH